MFMTKNDLRSKMLSQRNSLSEKEVIEMSKSIAIQLVLNINLIRKPIVHVFLPIKNKNEVNTFFLVDKLLKLNVTLCTSITDFDEKEMFVAELKEDTELELNKYNIPEPVNTMKIASETINICVIPLLAFDKEGNRIGYGNGYYDKFLAQKCNKNILKVGVSFFPPVDELIPADEWDQKLDFVVTPQKTYKFGERSMA